jgi:cysteine desulfurase / selenocysteine lyase
MIYLNNAATSFPKPGCVRNRIAACLCEPPDEAGRSAVSEGEVGRCRKHAACFFNAPCPEKMIYTSGATLSLNIAIRGLVTDKKKRFITTETEHNSVLRPLMHLKEERGIEIVFISCDSAGCIDPSEISGLLTEDTAGVIMTQGSNVTGAVHDVKAVSKHTRDAGIPLVVDTAQTAGLIPVDFEESGADILAFTGHKYLFGTGGTGGLILGPKIDLPPFISGGTGILSHQLNQPSRYPLRLEAGTPNELGIKALDSGIGYIENTGFTKIMNIGKEFRTRFIDGLAEIPGVTVHGPSVTNPQKALPLVSFSLSGGITSDPAEAGYIFLQSFGISVRAGLHCAPLIHRKLGTAGTGTIRVSPGILNSSEDIDRFIEAVSMMAKGNR